MKKDADVSEGIGQFREMLANIATKGPDASGASEYVHFRRELLDEPRVSDLLPEFIIDC